jgi:hypothetical protein
MTSRCVVSLKHDLKRRVFEALRVYPRQNCRGLIEATWTDFRNRVAQLPWPH